MEHVNGWFFLLNIATGFALAIDAFSASLANGLGEPRMKTRKMCLISGMFALFQCAMPFIGWVLITCFSTFFPFIETLIPWVALLLLGFLGAKMIIEGVKNKEEEAKALCAFSVLLLQSVATSIDALSAGLTLSEYGYNWAEALLACVIIGIVTFITCMIGVFIGKKGGSRLSGKASILGGAILIIIGLEIFITSWF